MDKKKLKLNIASDGKFTVTSTDQETVDEGVKRKLALGGEVVISSDSTFRFIPEKRYEELDQFFDTMFEGIATMGLTGENTNKILDLSRQLIETHTKLTLKLLENENQANDETVKIMKESSTHVTDKLMKISTSSRRLAELRKNPFFVEPKEISLALKWRTKTRADSDLPMHSLVPATCQFISIKKTLTAIFSEQNFQSIYTNHNSREAHQCEDGVYVNYCCGSTYKNKQIFQDRNVIQIQLAMDDFEICSPVKNNATKHKICGIYFRITNMPANIASKIDLVTSSDLKDDAVLQDLNELIVEELSKLETVGFITTDNKHWKAALINIQWRA